MTSRREGVCTMFLKYPIQGPTGSREVNSRTGTGDKSVLCDNPLKQVRRETVLELVSRRDFSRLLNKEAPPGVVVPGPGEIQAGTKWNGHST